MLEFSRSFSQVHVVWVHIVFDVSRRPNSFKAPYSAVCEQWKNLCDRYHCKVLRYSTLEMFSSYGNRCVTTSVNRHIYASSRSAVATTQNFYRGSERTPLRATLHFKCVSIWQASQAGGEWDFNLRAIFTKYCFPSHVSDMALTEAFSWWWRRDWDVNNKTSAKPTSQRR
jgi:hypothetical protein